MTPPGIPSSHLSVILVNYNGAGLLRRCLATLNEYTRGIAFETIVVDNDSQDGSCEMLAQEFPSVTLIRSKENMGFSRANNVAAASAHGAYYLFLNTDTVCIENAFLPMVEYLDAHSDIGALGPQLLFEDRQYQLSAGRLPSVGVEIQQKIMHALVRRWRRLFTPVFRSMFRNSRTVGWLTGACLMVREEAFRSIGGFDETMFMYFEDKDLCKRLNEAGWNIVYFPEASLIHLLAGSSGNVDSSKVGKIYRASQLRYYQKHHGAFQNMLLRFYLTLTRKI